jgi:hypothetical protein
MTGYQAAQRVLEKYGEAIEQSRKTLQTCRGAVLLASRWDCDEEVIRVFISEVEIARLRLNRLIAERSKFLQDNAHLFQ